MNNFGLGTVRTERLNMFLLLVFRMPSKTKPVSDHKNITYYQKWVETCNMRSQHMNIHLLSHQIFAASCALHVASMLCCNV